MELLQAKPKVQQYATPKSIGYIFCRKNPSTLLKNFREYAEKHPKTFYPHKPFIKNNGMDTLYDIMAFAFYFENRDLLESGTRSISFKEELPRLRQVYQSQEGAE